MATTYGVTSTGFVTKPLADALAELQALARATFGQGIKLNPSSKWGQFLGILADRETSIWDAMLDVYSSRDPEQATGPALRALCALTGTVQKPATYSAWPAASYPVLSGTPGTVVQAGKLVSVGSGGAQFALKADVTIGAGGTVAGNFVAVDSGPVPAPAGSLNTIVTPVSGWTGVTNAADATIGQAVETDAALRARRRAELSISGRGTVDAVRAALLAVAGVTSAAVFENVTGATDSNGLPAHSLQALVVGGADADVRAAVWTAKPTGIQTYGANSGNVNDSAGQPHAVSFDRPTIVPVYLIVNVQTDANFPINGAAQIQSALAAWGQANLQMGVDVVSFQLKRQITVPGVDDVPSLYIGTAANPTSEAKIAITSRQQAALDTSRITVNVSTFVP